MKGDLVLRNRIKEIREKKYLSQKELGEILGMTRSDIAQIENGEIIPDAKLALVISIALNKNFEEVFYF